MTATATVPIPVVTAANFLLSNDSDREELVARLVGRAAMPSPPPDSAGLPLDALFHGHAVVEDQPAPVDLAGHCPLAPTLDESAEPLLASAASPADDHLATVHDVAAFLLRNDTDREELVQVLRRAATEAEFLAAAESLRRAGAGANPSPVPDAADPSAEAVSAYELGDGADAAFNQLVMLENPGLANGFADASARAWVSKL
ncbi:hypothetical protein HK405_004895 [Cladochytrium tenue]|nr:hypothetical protein HK405_004895 [Cladochytrium tenue]